MSYYTPTEQLEQIGLSYSTVVGRDTPEVNGCVAPTADYGEGGLATFEVGLQASKLAIIPREEWAERLEFQDVARSSLQHRIDADDMPALTQGRCGYCWAYSVIGAMQAADVRDGLPLTRYSAASVAAQVKSGRDEGGWPVDAARWIDENGVCSLDSWGDCSCKGSGCGGPSRGCPARDLTQATDTKAEALQTRLGTFYELPRDDFDATVSALLWGLPVAGGWVNTGAWCDGHAMTLTRVIRTKQNGYQLVPDNSWGQYKRRTPVSRAPKGGVVLIHTQISEGDADE